MIKITMETYFKANQRIHRVHITMCTNLGCEIVRGTWCRQFLKCSNWYTLFSMDIFQVIRPRRRSSFELSQNVICFYAARLFARTGRL